MITNLNLSDDTIKGGYRQIVKKAHVSKNTVMSAFKKMRHLNILRHRSNITYINPDIVLMGNEQKRYVLDKAFEKLDQEY